MLRLMSITDHALSNRSWWKVFLKPLHQRSMWRAYLCVRQKSQHSVIHVYGKTGQERSYWADVVSYPRHPEVTPSPWHTGLPQANRKLPQGPNPIGTLVPRHRWFGKQSS